MPILSSQNTRSHSLCVQESGLFSRDSWLRHRKQSLLQVAWRVEMSQRRSHRLSGHCPNDASCELFRRKIALKRAASLAGSLSTQYNLKFGSRGGAGLWYTLSTRTFGKQND